MIVPNPLFAQTTIQPLCSTAACQSLQPKKNTVDSRFSHSQLSHNSQFSRIFAANQLYGYC